MDVLNQIINLLSVDGGSVVGNNVMPYFTLLALFIVVFMVYYAFRSFEKSKPSVEYIVLLALLTAISVVGRLIFIPIPGFQLATFIIIMAGVVYGRETGLFVGMLTAIVSDLITGIGYWLPYQMFAWGIIGYCSGLLNNRMEDIIFRTIFGLIAGFLFGWITNITMFYFLADFNMTTIMGVYLASLTFDLMHGICNVACLLLLYNLFKKILTRAGDKYLN